MKHAILPTYALIILVWMYPISEAKSPVTPLTTLPPDYYQVIITNNLFRPLGWTPPKSAPAFELIATVMKSDGAHNYSPTRELAAGTFIKKIEPRRVTVD